MLCVTALASLDPSATSLTSGVVGYSNVESDNHSAPLIGAMFQPISGASTYDLRELRLVGEDDDYADPGSEYIRVLDPNSLANLARYTYISREWMVDNFDESTAEYIDQFTWAIGWWRYEPGTDYQDIVEYQNDQANALRVTTAVNIDVGTAFIGGFSYAHSLRLVSKGGVPVSTVSIATGNNSAPMIANILPVDTSFFNMTISGDEGNTDDYADPGSEYLRVLDPDSLANAARYTYISREWMVDNFDESSAEYIAQFAWAIGWWRYVPGTDYQDIIEYQNDQTNELRLTVDVPVPAGSGFIGGFSYAHSLLINFPGVTVD